jgi:DNA processing protein
LVGWCDVMTTKEAYIALNLLPKIGPVRVRRLLEVFESPEAILKANRDKILAIEGFGSEMAKTLVNWEDHIDLQRELDLIRGAKVGVVSLDCPDYPGPLREIHDPPTVLYVWGTLTKADWRGIGVVGSRRATHYGLQTAKKLSYQIARAGLTVISGLARGIDTAAHEGALAGGRTVAVLGSGLGKLYPPENQVLAEKIAKQGAVVSEFPILYLPDKQSFPLRNRIVSGWSSGILVIEAPQRSGSLITANQAAEQGRNVYAVPGPIDRPNSVGCHRLIQDGAKLVMSVDDILEDFGQLALSMAEGSEPDSLPLAGLSDEERKVFALLSITEIGIEDIIRQAELPSQIVSTTLMRLEMKRLVKQLPGKHFVRL